MHFGPKGGYLLLWRMAARTDGWARVMHGTDTMAYSASALSFMFSELGKPVILTGAQKPMGEMRTDAIDNFQGALVW